MTSPYEVRLRQRFSEVRPGSDAFVPLPRTRHPAFTEGLARQARLLIGRLDEVELASSRPLFIGSADGKVVQASKPYLTVTLRPATWARPAPYVGKPFTYVWQGWQDGYGRWITGDAMLLYHPQMPEEQQGWPDYWHYMALPEG